MLFLAYRISGGAFDEPLTNVLLWGPAAAAAIAAVVVATNASPPVGWAAIGYIGWVATRPEVHVLQWVFAALALALMPIMQRPRGSLPLGLAVAGLVVLALHGVIGEVRV